MVKDERASKENTRQCKNLFNFELKDITGTLKTRKTLEGYVEGKYITERKNRAIQCIQQLTVKRNLSLSQLLPMEILVLLYMIYHRRLCLDCGFIKLYSNWDAAETTRYIVKVSCSKLTDFGQLTFSNLYYLISKMHISTNSTVYLQM